MNKILMLALLSCLYVAGHAQMLTVTDRETGQTLEAVTLISESPRAFATTNSKGQADISVFSQSEKIEIRLMGYQTENRSFSDLQSAGWAIQLTSGGLTIDDVVISATRWSQDSKEVPSKISTISAREVALQNPQTAADMLSLSGKVFIQKSQQGGGSPMIRGFSTNRLLYVVDGVRMNTAIFRSGNLQNVISLDPFATERTEVLFGPGSVIYGSDAIGGIMSFQTLTPQFSFQDKPFITGSAVARYSSANDEKTAHFDVRIGEKKWASVTSFSSNDFGDLRMGRHGPDEYLRPFYVQRIDSVDVTVINEDPLVQRPSGYSQINMMQKLAFQPNDKWDFQYGFHYSETSEYARYDRHIRYRNGLPRYGEWSYGPQIWMMNNLSITHRGHNKLYDQMALRIALQHFEESRLDRNINDAERHIRVEKVAATSANLDFIKSFGSHHQLFYGLEAVQNDVASSGTDEDIVSGEAMRGPSRYPQALWSSYAAYLNYQYRLNERILIQAGARYNQFILDATFDTTFYKFPYTTANINNGALTGSLGLVYRPTDKWAISGNLSSGFRAPNVDDMGKVFDSEPGAVLVPNPDLNAEYAWNAEVSLVKLIGESVKIDLTGYYTILQDALVRRDFTLNGQDSIIYDGTLSRVQAIQNAAVARVYGVQAGIEAKLGSGFGISTDFNYQKGEEEGDDGAISPSRHAPPWYGITRLTYAVKPLQLQVNAQYSGSRKFDELPPEEQGKPEIYAKDENGDPWSPGWLVFNVKAMYLVSDHFSVSAGLENITDRRYRPYSSGIVAPGRNLVISCKTIF